MRQVISRITLTIQILTFVNFPLQMSEKIVQIDPKSRRVFALHTIQKQIFVCKKAVTGVMNVTDVENPTLLSDHANRKTLISPHHLMFPNLPITNPRLPTPVLVDPLTVLLKEYSDSEYIINGFTNGFLLDYDGPFSSSICKNSQSVMDNSSLVQSKISEELSLSRIAGPFSDPPLENFKVSPLAIIPKKTPGKFRLIHNLSYPYNDESVNFHIDEKHSKVHYENLHSAIKLIQKYPKAYLAKTDIADAFRLIPLHPSQYCLTGFYFNGYFYDRVLPQGCSSSCKIFERFSSALKWILAEHYGIIDVVKVLDDFLFVAPSFSLCQQYLDKFKIISEILGVPIAEHKTEGPTTCLTFLGIELDSSFMVARLPSEKLQDYGCQLETLINSSKCTLRELKSIIGKLQFSTSVISTGRPFLRRLYDATIGVKYPHHFVSLSKNVKADLYMWQTFLNNYNGITIISKYDTLNSTDLHLFSDSSKLGFGGVYGTNYIYGPFPQSWHDYDIQFLELYPIFLLVNIFKNAFANKSIIFHCDNSSVVYALNKQTSRNKLVMTIIRKLVLIFLNHNIKFRALHILGKHNVLCDKLSRLQVSKRMLLKFGMNLAPTNIPHHLRPQNFRVE